MFLSQPHILRTSPSLGAVLTLRNGGHVISVAKYITEANKMLICLHL